LPIVCLLTDKWFAASAFGISVIAPMTDSYRRPCFARWFAGKSNVLKHFDAARLFLSETPNTIVEFKVFLGLIHVVFV
jgi:hypothetical protein